MTMIGASPEQLDQLARSLADAADRMDVDIRANLTSRINASPWQGGDAARFRSDWSTRLSPQLFQTAEALRQGASLLTSEAQEQRDASSAGGGLSGGGFAGGRSGVPDYSSDRGGSLGDGFVGGGGGGGGGGGWGPEAEASAGLPESLGAALELLKLPDGLELSDSWLAGALGNVADGFGFANRFAGLLADPTNTEELTRLFGEGIEIIGGVAEWAGKAKFGPLASAVGGMVGAYTDFGAAYQAFQDGDVLGGVWNIAHGAASGVGVFVPQVKLGVMAVDAAVAVGSFVVESGVGEDIVRGAGEFVQGAGNAISNAAKGFEAATDSAAKVVTGAAKSVGDAVGGLARGMTSWF